MKKSKLLSIAICIGVSIATYSRYVAYCDIKIECFGSYIAIPNNFPIELVTKYKILEQFCNNPNVLDNVNDWNELNYLARQLFRDLDAFYRDNRQNLDNAIESAVRNVFTDLAFQLSNKASNLQVINNFLTPNTVNRNFYKKMQQCWNILNNW